LVGRHLGGVPPHQYGTWVYFPWSGRLGHVLPESEFVELRTVRNRHKILKRDQAVLRKKTIGIAGLSVGASIAATLALEGIGGAFRLADHDALSLSNLNRLRAAVTDIRVNKAVLAGRALAEIDPYLDILVLDDGVTEQAASAFVEGLDLLIEECDDLEMKVRLREYARQHGVPVIMETSDRGTLDVERFDTDKSRPLFHGVAGNIQASNLRALSREDRVSIVMKILGPDMSPSAAASMLEIGESITTWPQLASGVTLGGATVTDAARRILLGRLTESGRFRVDFDRLVSDGQQGPLHNPGVFLAEPAIEAATPREPLPLPPLSKDPIPTPAEIRYLVEHAILAPSGGNAQPWRFEAYRNRVCASLDTYKLPGILNCDQLRGYVALGAAVENLVLASTAVGLEVTTDFHCEKARSRCDLTITRLSAPPSVDPLHRQVHRPVTNRRAGDQQALSPDERTTLKSALKTPDSRLQFVEDRETLDRLGALAGLGDRLRFLSPVMHANMMAEVRWDLGDVLSTRDGLDRATFEMDESELIGLRLLRDPDVPALLNRLDGSAMRIARRTERVFRSCSAAVLLTTTGQSPESFFEGGRALERVWLVATSLKLGFYPQSALPYLFAQLNQGTADGLTEREQSALRNLRHDYLRIFDIAGNEAEILLFCLSHAPPPTAHSLRRPVDSFLTIADTRHGITSAEIDY
jgi:nitroreductase